MATMLGSLLVSLGLDSGAFKSGLAGAEKELARAQKRIEKVGEGMVDFGTKMSMAVTVPMIGLIQQSIKGFKDQEAAMAQVNAALASMGDASGKTAAELAKTADALETKSLFDADVILKQVTANLLTFGNVAGEQFDRAQQAALDMATRLGGEPQAAAIMLGKALNDPVKGITALTRVGVQFTDAQKAQIAAMQAAGDTAGAQGIILAEVERQFRGAAQAAADVNPWREAQVAIGQAMDAIGKAAIPAIKPVAEAIASAAAAFAALPEPVQKGAVYVGMLVAVVGPLAMGLGAIISVASPLIAAFTTLGGIIPVVAAAASGLIAVLSPILVPLAAVTAAVGAVYLAWKNWDKIKAIASNVGSAISNWWSGSVAPALSNAWSMVKRGVVVWAELHIAALQYMAKMFNGVKMWLQDKLGAVFTWVIDKVKLVGQAFFQLYDAVVGHSYVPDMVDGIADQMARLDNVMVAVADKTTKKTADAFKALADEVRPLLDQLFPEAAALARFRQDAALLAKAERGGVISADQGTEALRRLRMGGADQTTQVAPGDTDITGQYVMEIQDALRKIGKAANDNAGNMEAANVRVVKSFKDMANDTLSALDRLAGSIKGGGFLDILSSVLNLGLQLGSMGVFGKTFQTNVNRPIPGYANGTNFHPGGMAVVGERGPELLNLPRGSQVIPNHELGAGGMAIQVVPSPYFDVRVQENIGQAAPSIVAAGSMASQRNAAWRNTRRVA